uniref:Uncharacterized protein n=1 Tax=Timema douglasi TaxID=61478 RepID=A0A7R8Z746_TIMDO|nr:unnamed protein product [Timema douglasi]
MSDRESGDDQPQGQTLGNYSSPMASLVLTSDSQHLGKYHGQSGAMEAGGGSDFDSGKLTDFSSACFVFTCMLCFYLTTCLGATTEQTDNLTGSSAQLPADFVVNFFITVVILFKVIHYECGGMILDENSLESDGGSMLSKRMVKTEKVAGDIKMSGRTNDDEVLAKFLLKGCVEKLWGKDLGCAMWFLAKWFQCLAVTTCRSSDSKWLQFLSPPAGLLVGGFRARCHHLQVR